MNSNTQSLILLAACLLMPVIALNAQVAGKPAPSTTTIEVIQFHNAHRCETCLKIEKQTKATLAKFYPNIPFRLVNVEEKKNEKMVNQFEAFGTSLFLYDPKTGRKKDLTDFAFMNAQNAGQFEKQLHQHVADFLKG